METLFLIVWYQSDNIEKKKYEEWYKENYL